MFCAPLLLLLLPALAKPAQPRRQAHAREEQGNESSQNRLLHVCRVAVSLQHFLFPQLPDPASRVSACVPQRIHRLRFGSAWRNWTQGVKKGNRAELQ